METDGDLTYNCGLNALSDARLKENIREADLEELQANFRQSNVQVLRSHRRATQEPAGLCGALLEALSRSLGSLQEAASQSGSCER